MERCRINAVVVQRICPHYRVPLFLRLAHSDNVRFAFAYGESRSDDALQSMIPVGLKHIPMKNIWIPPSGLWVWQVGALRLGLQKDVDIYIVEANPYIISNMLLCLLAKIRGKRVLLWGHGVGSKKSLGARTLRVILPRLLGGYIYYDQERANTVRSWGLPDRHIFVANNSIDTKEIVRLASPWKAEDRTNVLYIGRLLEEKMVDLLIRGFARAATRLPRTANLLIIGDGPEKHSLQLLVDSLGLASHVRFLGEITGNPDLAPFFNSCCCSIFPGPAGLGLIHSLAFGLPVLVVERSDHGPEISAVQEGVTGRYFRMDDEDDLARKLVELFGAYEEQERMSQKAREITVNDYSIEDMVSVFERACHSMAEKSR